MKRSKAQEIPGGARRRHAALCALLWLLLSAGRLAAEPAETELAGGLPLTPTSTPQMDVLSDQEWRAVDQSIDRALAWLATQQRPNGSFNSIDLGQPGVTSLCAMAFLANGHLPGEGPYGATLSHAMAYVRNTQTASGILAVTASPGTAIGRNYSHLGGKVVAYNHAIASLALAEVYGMRADRHAAQARVIERALAASFQMQRWPKTRPVDAGGWRYAHDDGYADSDLSITGWQLMFLRSAQNAGFEVEQQVIDDAVDYVLRCYSTKNQTFRYYLWPETERYSRGMAGAGVLALAHAGKHHRPEAQKTGDWILRNGFARYNVIMRWDQTRWHNDRYHYGVFYCSQAMYQLGGKHWQEFYPAVVEVLLRSQDPSGAWREEAGGEDGRFGRTYTTALATLALSAPNQVLPIFQR